MKVFSRFESNGFPGRYIDFGASAWIAADTGLPGLDREDTKSAKLNAIAFHEALLHGVEDGVHGGFSLGPYQTGTLNDSLDKILFDQE